MKRIRSRLTYSNVIASLALFFALAGGTAFAASQLGKNSVGSKQLKSKSVTTAKIKKNAVTRAKIKANAITGAKVQDGSLTGADINLSTLGTVPTATKLTNQTPFTILMPEGIREIGTFGAFTIKAQCIINEGGNDHAKFLLYTTEEHSAMDDNNGPEHDDFGPADSPIEMFTESETTGKTDIEAGGSGFLAMAPGGTRIAANGLWIAVNPPGHVGNCYFAGAFETLG